MTSDKTDEELVYDLSKYMDSHPGGSEILLEAAKAYKDSDGDDNADEMFDSIGHTSGAKNDRDKLVIGKLPADPNRKAKVRKSGATLGSEGGGGLNMFAVLAVLAVIAAGLYYQYEQNKNKK